MDKNIDFNLISPSEIIEAATKLQALINKPTKTRQDYMDMEGYVYSLTELTEELNNGLTHLKFKLNGRNK